MNMNAPIMWFSKLFSDSGKTEKLKLLQQQRMLLYTGVETTAEVIDAILLSDSLGRLLRIRLWLKLKKADGSFIFTHAHTLVSANHVPGKGQQLRIKYLPENLASILILDNS